MAAERTLDPAADSRPTDWNSSDAARAWPWLLTASRFVDLVDARAAATPEAPMLFEADGTTVTCAEFAERSRRVAAALAAEGLGRGTRVAWQLPTRISTLLVMAALRRLGAVQAPIIPQYREREVTAALAGSAAEVFLVPGVWRGTDFVALAAQVAAAGGPAPRTLVIGAEAPEADPVGSPAEAVDDLDEVAWIYFTSGSTGAPKGAQHTDTTLLSTGLGFAGNGELGRTAGEVAAIGFPVAHVGGVEYLIAMLAGGYPALVLEAFVPAEAVQLFRRYGVTTTGGAPPFYSALVAMGRAQPGEPVLPGLRTLKGGGAPCPPALFDEVRDVLDAVLAHDYGMTEVPMIAVGRPSDPADVLAATDGTVLPSNRVRLVDADGVPVPAGEIGEVQVTGAGVCHGYTDPAETAAAFTADGWFRTGDLGRFHPAGPIEVVGRVKDLIIRNAENIAPQEIEQVLAGHPAVAEVAVIGLPDPVCGERVCAVVAPVAGHPAPDLPTLNAWLLDAGLMKQKLPEQLETVDALPRTGLAKVAKAELRRRFTMA
ncbi:class I adenylate-forming enzyme family protein [Cryptosporangium aurantiacum]|uniref:Acyl-CoA synthetase (AMP-forming)/AMP-acid ligase II n=1 Tax=Cryptosporangium aurantiacum TaxID=134849 RepID=A0A1M7PG54_9ACTN|nr:AMP-binding protein [Cryptosporangium aurantiacum]SHN16035.1 Acyl-CoA synthetase (AMP-forming)/AMP-acid ligase II [Cryptosporangium aurantiacum]